MSSDESSGAAGVSPTAEAVGAHLTRPPNPYYQRRCWAAAVICGALIRGGTSLHHEAGQPGPLDEIVSALI
jgi:hypothetical protein